MDIIIKREINEVIKRVFSMTTTLLYKNNYEEFLKDFSDMGYDHVKAIRDFVKKNDAELHFKENVIDDLSHIAEKFDLQLSEMLDEYIRSEEANINILRSLIEIAKKENDDERTNT